MKKMYFITVISGYEEVYINKKINLKKMNKAIFLMRKQKISNFIKKIRQRQIISEYTKQTKEVFNPYGKQKGFRKSRTMMFFDNFKKAENAIKTNNCDLLESGSWGSPTFAVIEEYHEGFCLAEKRWFYEIKFNKKRNFTIKQIKEPIWAIGTINYAF